MRIKPEKDSHKCRKCPNMLSWEYTTDTNGNIISICGECGAWNVDNSFWVNDAMGALINRPTLVGSGHSSAAEIRTELGMKASAMT